MKKLKYSAPLLAALLMSSGAEAQSSLLPTSLSPVMAAILAAVVAVALLVLVVVFYAYQVLRLMLDRVKAEALATQTAAAEAGDPAAVAALAEAQAEAEPRSWWQRVDRKLTDAVPIEKEKDILLDHDYDGIRELDNHLPPWWVALFYGSIAFAVVYLCVYHVFDVAPLQEEEYQIELAEAAEAAEARKLLANNSLDETNVELTSDAALLANGQELFVKNCAACHGAEGGGGVGPNLTDEYWLHGGDIKDVFKTIKYGIPQKGMIPWEAKLSPDQMRDVSSYIISIEGSNPPNAKEPQGDKYEREKLTQRDEADGKELAQL